MINIGIGVAWAKSLYSVANNIIANFRARVLSYPNSIFEAGPCLDATLEELNAVGLLDDASLIVTPNAYNEGVLYDVIPNTPLGDMDVVRATTATRVNSAGLIEVVPRNLLTYSNDFTNAIWTKDNVTLTSGVTSPSGVNNAFKLVESATTASHSIYQTFITLPSSIYTTSIYVKKGERFKVAVADRNTGIYVAFNLNTGTIIASNSLIGSIELLNNDWYRLTVTTSSAISVYVPQFFILEDSYTTGFPILQPYLGNGTSGIFIYASQLENFATATEYFPTTTRLNIPRIDYTNGSCPSLLVEPQRTNIALNTDGNLSTYFNVNVTNASSSFNSFVNAIQFPSTGLAIAYKSTVTTAQVYAISVFIKMDDNSVPILSASSTTGNMSLVIGGAVVTNNLKVESYGNNVYRLSGTATSAGLNINNGVIRYDTQVLKSFKITGIQLEAGAYPTSYIPTVASTVTRNADVISKTGISSLIGQTEGTVFLEADIQKRNASEFYIAISNGFSLGEAIYLNQPSSGNLNVLFRTGVLTPTISILSADWNIGNNKIAIAYNSTLGEVFINGVSKGTVALTGLPTCNQITLGSRPDSPGSLVGAGPYKQAILFKTRLTNEQLTLLTGDLYDSYAEMANSLNYILE
jgi:hypothetical protein